MHGFASYLQRIHSGVVPINCENLKQIHAGEGLKKIDLNLLLFDVGGQPSLLMAGIQVNFEICPIFCSIYLIPTLNLRPGLNSAWPFSHI